MNILSIYVVLFVGVLVAAVVSLTDTSEKCIKRWVFERYEDWRRNKLLPFVQEYGKLCHTQGRKRKAFVPNRPPYPDFLSFWDGKSIEPPLNKAVFGKAILFGILLIGLAWGISYQYSCFVLERAEKRAEVVEMEARKVAFENLGERTAINWESWTRVIYGSRSFSKAFECWERVILDSPEEVFLREMILRRMYEYPPESADECKEHFLLLYSGRHIFKGAFIRWANAVSSEREFSEMAYHLSLLSNEEVSDIVEKVYFPAVEDDSLRLSE